MNQAAPTVLLLVNAPAERTEFRQWLEATDHWQVTCLDVEEVTTKDTSTGSTAPLLQTAPDLVLLDESGFRAAGAALRSHWQPDSPLFVVLLEEDDEALAAAVLAAGAADYLVKSQLHQTRLLQTLALLARPVQPRRSPPPCPQDVFAHAAIGLNQADKSGRFIRVNQYFCDLLGYSEAELLQLTYQEITHPDDLAAQADWETQLFSQDSETITVEKRYRTKAGDYLWTRVTLSIVKDDHDRAISDLAIVEDASDRRQLENRLHESEAELRGLFEALDEVVLVFDRQGTYLKVAPSGHDKLYRPPAALLGKTVREILPKALAQDVLRCIEQVLTSQQSQEFEYRLPVNGREQWFGARCSPLTAEQVIWVARDINDRKRSELERQQAIAALAQNEAKFRALIENASEITYARHLDGTLTYLSPQAETILGYAPAELIGNQRWGALVHPEDMAAAQHNVEHLIASGQPQREIELRVRHRDGHWHWMRTNIAPIFDGDGTLVGIRGTSADIHHQKQAERALQRSQAQFAAIYHQAAVGICLVSSPTSQIISANQWFCDFLGYSETELQQMHYADYSYPDDMVADDVFMARLLANEITDFTLEKRYFHRSGQLHWVNLNVSLVKDGDGQPSHTVAIVQDITDRKAAELALESSERKHRVLVEALPDLIIRMSRDGVYLDFFAASNMTVLQAEGLVGCHMYERGLPRDLAERRMGYINQAVETGQLQIYEQSLFNGEKQAIEEVRIVPSGDDEILIIVRDISDRKQAEQALQQANADLSRQTLQLQQVNEALRFTLERLQSAQEELQCQNEELLQTRQQVDRERRRYQSLFNFAPDGYVVTDADGLIQEANQVVAQLIGIEPSKLVDFPLSHRMWVADRPAFRSLLSELRQQAPGHRVETEKLSLWSNQAQKVPIALTAMSLSDELGQLVAICWSIKDISDRQQAEASLRRSEQRLQTLINALPFGVWVRDADDRLVLQNKVDIERFGNILGTSRSELTGLPDAAKIYLECRQHAQLGECFRYDRQETVAGEARYFRRIIGRFPDLDGREGMFGVYIDTTQEKQAEIALRESERRYAALTEVSPVGVFRIDAVGQCIYVNPRLGELSGLAAEDMYQDGWIRSLHPDDRDSLLTRWTEAFTQQAVFRAEGRYLLPDGSITWFDCQATPEWDEAGSFLGYVGTLSDITHRKQAELERQQAQMALEQLNHRLEAQVRDRTAVLAARERELNSIFSSAAAGMAQIDPQSHQFLKVNQHFCNWLGYRRTALDALDWEQLIHADDRDRCAAYLQKLARREIEEFSLEKRFVAQDGNIIWADTSMSAVWDTDGELSYYILVIVDITERKRAEMQLRDSEARLRATFEQAAVGIGQTNLQGQIIQANEKFCDLVGYPKAELLSKHFNDITHPDDRATDQRHMTRLLAGEVDNFILEKRYIHKSGRIVWANLSVAVICDAAGNHQYCMAVIQDISDRKRVEQQLQAERLRLQVALEAAQMGTWESNLEEEIWSEQTEAIFGFAPGTFSGDRTAFCDRLHPDDRDRVLTASRENFLNGQPHSLEYRIYRLDGELRWIAIHAKALTVDGDTRLKMIGVALDITERKQAEEALRDNEERLRLALNASNQGLYDLDLRTGEAIVSATYTTMLGYSPINFHETNAKWLQRLHPDDTERVRAVYRAYVAGEIPEYKVEFRQRMKNGRWKWILSVGKIVAWDQQGNPIRLLGTHTDIDELKRAEELVRASEERFRQLADNIKEVFWLTTPDHQILYISPAYEQIWGRPIAGITTESFFETILPEDRRRLGLYPDDQAQIPQPLEDGEEVEYRIIRPDGTIRWIRDRAFPVRDAQGRVHRIAGVAEDITERKQAAIELQKLAAVVENSTDMIGIATLQGETLYINAAGRQLLGLPENAELVGMPITDQVSLAAMTQFEQEILPTVRETGTWNGDNYLRHQQTAEDIVVEQSIFLIRDDQSHEPLFIATLVRDIRDRKAAEMALRESQQFTQSITENTPNLIYIYDLRQQRNIYSNQEVLSLLGYAIEDIQAMADRFLPSVIHPDDWPSIVQGQQVIAAAADKQICEFEYRVRHANGEWRWLYDRVSPFQRDEAGNVIQYIGLAQDISDRKAAETALRETQQFTQSITENTPNIIYIYDLRQQCNIYCNQELFSLLGYTVEDIQALGDRLLPSVIHPDDVPTLRQGLQTVAAAADKQICELEYRARHADGTWRWLYDRISPFQRDEAGNVIQYIGLAQDISDRKALEEEQARLISILEASPDHIGMAKPDGTVLWNNRQAKILSGLPLDVDVTQIPVSAYHPEWALETLQQVGIPTAMQEGIWVGETALLKPDGGEIPVSQLILAHKSLNGEVEYLSTIIRDISTLKQAEQSLRKVNAELETRVSERTTELIEAKDAAETASRAKSKFLANMSHELRTPLNAILGFSELMERDRTLSPKHLQEARIIHRSGEHLLTLINDVLEMSKIEAEQVVLSPSSFELSQLLSSLFDMLRLKAESKELTLTLSSHPDLPYYIRTDGHKLRQVLLNLLSNAIKFTSAGYVTLRVQSSRPTHREPLADWLTEANGDIVMLHFAVEDSGVGIAPEELDLLFEPFMQTSSGRRSQEGTGLGLPISRQFVQLMGGSLAVESQLDRGSIFTFTIPVQVIEADTVDWSETPSRVIAIAPDQPCYRLLVVEDNQANLVLMQNLLTDLGFEVQVAVNGQAAVEFWQTWQPHLIFMDIRMPVMTGIEATQAIRQREQALAQGDSAIQPTKIISLTAGVFEEDQTELAAIGFDDFLRKPITETVITQALARHLGIHYVYEAADQAQPAQLSDPPLTVELLATLSIDWLRRFHTAILQLDQAQMLALIADIPEHQAHLAHVLSRKVNDFDYEVLLNLTQTILA